MTPTCASCGRTVPESRLRWLVLAGRDRRERGFGLCERCVDIRQVDLWPARDALTDRIVDALRGRGYGSGSFAYLSDEEADLRLLRLRSAWIDAKAESGDA